MEPVSLAARDDRHFYVTAAAWSSARAALAAWMQRGRRVLVYCWGGVNCSWSVVLLWRVVCEGWPFLGAMRLVTLAMHTEDDVHGLRAAAGVEGLSRDPRDGQGLREAGGVDGSSGDARDSPSRCPVPACGWRG